MVGTFCRHSRYEKNLTSVDNIKMFMDSVASNLTCKRLTCKKVSPKLEEFNQLQLVRFINLSRLRSQRSRLLPYRLFA